MDYETRIEVNRSGIWEIRWSEPDKERPGKWRSRSVSTRTKDRLAAEKVRSAFLRADREVSRGPGPVMVETLLDGYETAAVRRGIGVSQRAVLRYLRRAFAGTAVDEITPGVVADYGSDRDVTPSTLRRELAALRTVLVWGAKHKLIPEPVPVVELPPAGAPRVMFLDEAREGALYERAAKAVAEGGGPGARAGLFVCIALDTGARRAAIEGLTWDRVDLVRGMIDFRDPDLRVTKKRRVSTPVPDRLMSVLRGASAAASASRDGTDYVLGFRGARLRTSLDTFLRDAGFADVTAHVFRHTRITLLLRAGVSVWDVSALVGASPEVISDVYGHHVADDRLRAQANRRAAA